MNNLYNQDGLNWVSTFESRINLDNVRKIATRLLTLRCKFCGGCGHDMYHCPTKAQFKREAKKDNCNWELGALKGAIEPPTEEVIALGKRKHDLRQWKPRKYQRHF